MAETNENKPAPKKKKEPKVVSEFAGQMALQVLDNGEERVFADFRTPRGTRLKLIELQIKK